MTETNEHAVYAKQADGPEPDPPENEAALRLKDVHKRYGSAQALSGLNLNVTEGDIYGLLGRNGAGKSTALRIAMGLTKANHGTVEIFGHQLRRGDTGTKQAIGYVAQEQVFYEWMTANSIGRFVSGFYPTWDDGEYLRLLHLLEIPTDRKIRTFSGGTHAKLALALALAHRPRLLLLDEPTAGMDPVARREFIEIIHDQAERAHRTTIFSSHLIDEVELAADTVGIVHQGRMLYQGALDGLRTRSRVFVHAAEGGLHPVFPAIDHTISTGLEVLQDRTYRGERRLVLMADDPSRLERLDVGGWRAITPSLEDTFVAMVTRSVDL